MNFNYENQDDRVRGVGITETLRGLLPHEPYGGNPVCKFDTSLGLRGIQSGVAALEDRFYEIENEGVVRVREGFSLHGLMLSVYFYGFNPDSEKYNYLKAELKKMGFERELSEREQMDVLIDVDLRGGSAR